MDRPVPPQLALPAYISWLPPLVVFLAKALGYQAAAEAYMDSLEARIAELEAATPIPTPVTAPPPVLAIVDKPLQPWMTTLVAPFTTNLGTSLTGMRVVFNTYSYRVVSKADFLKVVDYWRRTARPLWAEKFKAEPQLEQCDWWSLSFVGWCLTTFQLDSVGLVIDHGSLHSYNFIAYEDGTLELFDPEYDSFAVVGTTGHGFKEGLLLL